MDRTWIPNGVPFSDTFTVGVEEFIEWVKQRYLGKRSLARVEIILTRWIIVGRT
jgi:hypothetical protein